MLLLSCVILLLSCVLLSRVTVARAYRVDIAISIHVTAADAVGSTERTTAHAQAVGTHLTRTSKPTHLKCKIFCIPTDLIKILGFDRPKCKIAWI
jgi:hypothetical protein